MQSGTHWRHRFRPPVAVYYHQIDDAAAERFERQMRWLLSHRQIVPLSTVVDQARRGRYDPRMVAVTFDDVFEDAIRNAVSCLERLSIPATLFPVVRYLGRRAGWDDAGGPGHPSVASGPQPNRASKAPRAGRCLSGNQETALVLRGGQLASIDMLRGLRQDLFEIGSHTLNHPNVAACGTDKLIEELLGSRRELEDALHRRVRYLSLPYGAWSPEVLRHAVEAGYEAVMLTHASGYLQHDGNVALARMPLLAEDPLWLCRTKLGPVGPLAAPLWRRWRRWARRVPPKAACT